MRRLCLLSIVFLLLSVSLAAAALTFPALTGRVVDDAGILTDSSRQSLDQTLADYERQSGNQLVVVTLRSLEGTAIEDYGYQLGRQWGIGQKGKNNGVLLIVAPNERKVRIEVGYGMESVLTDALASDIIRTIILPEFRAGRMEAGIIKGTDAIIQVLGGHALAVNSQPSPGIGARNDSGADSWFGFGVLFFVLLNVLARLLACPSIPGRQGFIGGGYYGGVSGNGGIGPRGFGGGFTGGGGSFGGGGASGGW